MDAGLTTRAGLALLLIVAAGAVRADLYLCSDGSGTGHRRIQDQPCGAGQRADAHVKERNGRSVAPAVTTGPSRPVGGRTGAIEETGIRKNKTVICQLLDGEKRDTEAQIRGAAVAPPGENPKDNLVKIERQRTRVGCDSTS